MHLVRKLEGLKQYVYVCVCILLLASMIHVITLQRYRAFVTQILHSNDQTSNEISLPEN